MLIVADAFATGTAAILAASLLLFLAIGRWHSRSGTDIMDGDRKERWGVQAGIEEGDIDEMVDADNERRARRGQRRRTTREVTEEVAADQLGRLRRGREDRERRGF